MVVVRVQCLSPVWLNSQGIVWTTYNTSWDVQRVCRKSMSEDRLQTYQGHVKCVIVVLWNFSRRGDVDVSENPPINVAQVYAEYPPRSDHSRTALETL